MVIWMVPRLLKSVCFPRPCSCLFAVPCPWFQVWSPPPVHFIIIYKYTAHEFPRAFLWNGPFASVGTFNLYILRARATLGYRGKKCPKVRFMKSYVYVLLQYVVVSIYNVNAITRSLSRWHSRSSAWLGSISNASTTWGRSSADGIGIHTNYYSSCQWSQNTRGRADATTNNAPTTISFS